MPVKGRLWPCDDDDEELGSDEEKSIAPKIRKPSQKCSVMSLKQFYEVVLACL